MFSVNSLGTEVSHTRNISIELFYFSIAGGKNYIFLVLIDWLDNVFFPTNKKRLKEAQNILVDGLADVGIPVLKSSGGLYVWADFRKVCKKFEKGWECKTWKCKVYLCMLLHTYQSPGKSFQWLYLLVQPLIQDYFLLLVLKITDI